MKSAAIILARGGSKGIPEKNIVSFCGKPLICWTIRACLGAGLETYVSTDCEKIKEIAQEEGCEVIDRPFELASDEATSESGWLHALGVLGSRGKSFDWIVAPQVTSPFTTAEDIKLGLTMAHSGKYDSLLSGSMFEDLMVWKNGKSVSYDWRTRGRRQESLPTYIENGAFYLFRPTVLEETNNRLGKPTSDYGWSRKIGIVPMDSWKIFEIDSPQDLRICSTLMKEFLLNE